VDTKSLTATECNSMTSAPYVENGEFDDTTKLKKEEKTWIRQLRYLMILDRLLLLLYLVYYYW
jgi:hypothetical protein